VHLSSRPNSVTHKVAEERGSEVQKEKKRFHLNGKEAKEMLMHLPAAVVERAVYPNYSESQSQHGKIDPQDLPAPITEKTVHSFHGLGPKAERIMKWRNEDKIGNGLKKETRIKPRLEQENTDRTAFIYP